MNLKDLQNIDIKDLKEIDLDTIKGHLLGNQNYLVNFIVCLVAVVAAIYAFGVWKNSSVNAKQVIAELKKKAKAVQEHNKTKSEMEEFKKGIDTSVSGGRLVGMLSKIANESGVQIVSLSRPVKTTSPFVDLTSTVITVSSDDYASHIRFMHEIENSNYMLRVSNWDGSLKGANQRSRRSRRNTRATYADEDNSIETNIVIEIVELKVE